MKIAIIGAGMAGVAAAHALAAAGHDVSVLERRASVAEETSFAPAGLAAPGLAAPWLAGPAGLRLPWSREVQPAIPRDTGRAASGRLPRDAAAAAREDARARALHRLLGAGLERIETLARQQGLEFERGQGLLLTFADEPALAQGRLAAQWLADAGEAVEWADAARQRELEPGRAVADDALPAAYLKAARIGNPREWTQLLRQQAQALGVRFRFRHEAVGIVPGRRPVLRVRALDRQGPAQAPADEEIDAVVVCAALDSQQLLAPLGLALPWLPIRGWSITVPLQLREALPDTGPRAALLDVREGVSITRLGTRVRVAGGHERVAGGHERAAAATAATGEPPPARLLRPLYAALDASFPGAVQWAQAQGWQGTRPALADGLPAVGASGLEGVWLNVGHGHHGWALSQVAAETLCAMIAGLEPETDAAALAPHRFA